MVGTVLKQGTAKYNDDTINVELEWALLNQSEITILTKELYEGCAFPPWLGQLLWLPQLDKIVQALEKVINLHKAHSNFDVTNELNTSIRHAEDCYPPLSNWKWL